MLKRTLLLTALILGTTALSAAEITVTNPKPMAKGAQMSVSLVMDQVGKQVGKELGLKWVSTTWRGNGDGSKVGAVAHIFQAPELGNEKMARQLISKAAARALEITNGHGALVGQLDPYPLGGENLLIAVAQPDDIENHSEQLTCVTYEFGDILIG